MRYLPALAGLSMLVSGAAFAQDTAPPKSLTLSGSVGLVSDYLYRGVSQSDREMAIQGGLTLTHKSGFYVGTWASNLSGWGTFGGSNMELDLIGGYKMPIGDGGALDVGLTWYMYPGGFSNTDFAEPYVKLSGTAGPVSLTAGVAYAPKQQALGNWSNTPSSRAGDKEDNLYLWGDFATAIPSTPVTAKAHIGYSDGNPGLGPNGTSVAPTGKYWDWMVGADLSLAPMLDVPLTLGVAYVDTDISRRESLYLQPNLSKGQDGTGSIVSGRVVVSLTAAF
jgi:uncharacterized protein (TIGR02001 family)